MKKIILADNQFITSEGIRAVFSPLGDFDFSKVQTKKELVAMLGNEPTSVVILDYALFDFQSADELCNFGLRFSSASWLLFSTELSDNLIRQVYFSAPNFSILYKDCSSDEVRLCIQEILKNRRYVCGIVSNALLDTVYKQQTEAEKARLTPTEKDILKEIASGKTTKEIAQKRHSSMHTVISHRKNIFRKIEVNNIHEATKYAVKAGLVDLSDYFI
ncbi:MAG: response regulator transcription factor [Paludibacteraceae bacterium]